MSIAVANVDERVKQTIAQQLALDNSQVTGEKKINEDLGADSLDAVEIVMAMEDEFAIELPDEDAEKCKTVQDWVDLVTRFTA